MNRRHWLLFLYPILSYPAQADESALTKKPYIFTKMATPVEVQHIIATHWLKSLKREGQDLLTKRDVTEQTGNDFTFKKMYGFDVDENLISFQSGTLFTEYWENEDYHTFMDVVLAASKYWNFILYFNKKREGYLKQEGLFLMQRDSAWPIGFSAFYAMPIDHSIKESLTHISDAGDYITMSPWPCRSIIIFCLRRNHIRQINISRRYPRESVTCTAISSEGHDAFYALTNNNIYTVDCRSQHLVINLLAVMNAPIKYLIANDSGSKVVAYLTDGNIMLIEKDGHVLHLAQFPQIKSIQLTSKFINIITQESTPILYQYDYDGVFSSGRLLPNDTVIAWISRYEKRLMLHTKKRRTLFYMDPLNRILNQKNKLFCSIIQLMYLEQFRQALVLEQQDDLNLEQKNKLHKLIAFLTTGVYPYDNCTYNFRKLINTSLLDHVDSNVPLLKKRLQIA